MNEKVFCIGMFKTGTTSMGKALEILGYHTLNGPWWPDGIMLRDPWHEQPDEWPKYDEIIKTQAEIYDAFQDYPWMYCYEKCDRWFPGSRFILTVRDPVKVAESDIRMWRNNKVAGHQIPAKEKFIARYNRHYESVSRYFAGRNNLLVIDITEGAGWPEICGFLDKPVPQRDFPHLNKGRNSAQRSILGRTLARILGDRTST